MKEKKAGSFNYKIGVETIPSWDTENHPASETKE